MKKIIYITLLAFSASLMLTSCTEENVAPKADESVQAGGSTSSDKGA